MRVFWNTCEKELGYEMKSVNEVCQWKLLQKFTWKLPKVTPFKRNLCIKYLEKNSIQI